MDDKLIERYATKIAADGERQFAGILDELAALVEEHEMSYHEASWMLRTAAGHLRDYAAKEEAKV